MSAKLGIVRIFLLFLWFVTDLTAANWRSEALGQKNCSFPDVAVDSKGNCVAAWIYFDGTHSYVQAATKQVKGKWSDTYTFKMAEQEATSISVAMDPKGNAVAVWTSTDGKFSMVQSAKMSAGDFSTNTWSLINEPLTILVFMGSFPKVHFDKQGNALAAWGAYDYEGSKIVIEAARLLVDASSWKRVDNCTQLSKDISSFEFALDPSGNAVAIWECHQDPLQIYAASLSFDSSSWSEPILLSSEKSPATCPKIAVDKEGNAVAAWWTMSKSIKAATLPFGAKEWQRTRLPKINSPFFSLGMTPEGDALLVWEPEHPGCIQYSILSKSKKVWTKPSAASTKGQEARAPLLRINSKGNAVAIWENHMLGNIQGAALRMSNRVWTPPKALARVQLDSAVPLGRPVIGVHGSDSAIVLYPTQDSVQIVYGKELFGIKHLQVQDVNYELKQLKLFRALDKRKKQAKR